MNAIHEITAIAVITMVVTVLLLYRTDPAGNYIAEQEVTQYKSGYEKDKVEDHSQEPFEQQRE